MTTQAADLSTLGNQLSTLENKTISKELVDKMNELKERNIVLKNRPQFCPMNNTNALENIKQGLNNIEAIFQDDCLDGNQATIDQILAGSQSLEEQINETIASSGSDSEMDVTGIAEQDLGIPGTEINGQELAGVINGINSVLKKKKCSNLDDSNFLENAADVIQNFSQLGIYSTNPTGVTVAFGGLAVGSALRFISDLFSSRFEFKSEQDRMTFIKLNCAYYDLRNQMQNAGILDISTDQHYIDLPQAQDVVKKLTTDIETMNKAKVAILKELEEIKKSEMTSLDKELEAIIKPIANKVAEKVEDKPGYPAEAQRNDILDVLTLNYATLMATLNERYFTAGNNGRLSRQNRSFKRYLNMVDETGNMEQVIKLEEMKIEDFNNLFLRHMAFNLNRVLKDIEGKRTNADSNFENNETVTVAGETLKVKDFRARLEGKKITESFKNFTTALTDMQSMQKRLEGLTGKKEFSSTDSNDGGLLRILEANDTIVNHIYGDYGFDFVVYATEKSKRINDNFITDVKDYAQDYLLGTLKVKSKKYNDDDEDDYVLKVEAKNLRIKDPTSVNEDEKQSACVSAKSLREKWRYGQRWAELGYDFLSTNYDLFSSDENSTRKRLRKHADSAILARRIITAENKVKKMAIAGIELDAKVNFHGKTMNIEKAKDKLEKDYGKGFVRNPRLGKIMMEVHEARKFSVILQDLYQAYRCDTASNFDR